MKNIEEQIDAGFLHTIERRLGVRSVVIKIWLILINLAKVSNAMESRMKRFALIDTTVQRLSRVGGNPGLVPLFARLSTIRPITPGPLRPLIRGAPTTSSIRRSKAIVPLKLTSALDELPVSLDGEVTDFTNAK